MAVSMILNTWHSSSYCMRHSWLTQCGLLAWTGLYKMVAIIKNVSCPNNILSVNHKYLGNWDGHERAPCTRQEREDERTLQFVLRLWRFDEQALLGGTWTTISMKLGHEKRRVRQSIAYSFLSTKRPQKLQQATALKRIFGSRFARNT